MIENWQKQHTRFVALLVGIFILIGLLVVRYDYKIDVAFNQRNSLSLQGIQIAKQLSDPLKVTAFAQGNLKVKKLINSNLVSYKIGELNSASDRVYVGRRLRVAAMKHYPCVTSSLLQLL